MSLAGWRILLLLILLALVNGGCATNPRNPDPWEKTNRFFYGFNDGLDHLLLKPGADLYVKIVPLPVRTGLANGFANLNYGDVILNDFLQGMWHQGWSDAGRMALNSTFGVAGILDIASRYGMTPHENHFGVTLGKWGAGPGPYLVLPFFGPSSVRDSPDIVVSAVTNPIFWVSDVPFAATWTLDATQAVGKRSRSEEAVRFRNQAAVDPYVFTREAYLAYRRQLIHPESAPAETDLYDEPAEPTTRPSGGESR
jgi:phospholipid-binding lipoprotein MlaA